MLRSFKSHCQNHDSIPARPVSDGDGAPARWLAAKLALIALALVAATGCQTQKPISPAVAAAAAMGAGTTNNPDALTLREGDTLKISFPGAAANLTDTHLISRDGNITMPLVGEIKAAGKTIDQLKADLLTAYAGQIETKIVTVELVSSAFPVYVTGAVLNPGKVMSDHPMTVLEAIMERGGFDYSKANLKSVEVLRQEGGVLKSYDLNLKEVMDGTRMEQFFLRPSDIIYVRERFQWF
jgi:polysaccharide biosynthesis/export protein